MRQAIDCAIILSAVAVTSAAEPAPRYDLDTVEFIKAFVGSQEARDTLARQGLVVTDQQFKQIFSAYIGGHVPKFCLGSP